MPPAQTAVTGRAEGDVRTIFAGLGVMGTFAPTIAMARSGSPWPGPGKATKRVVFKDDILSSSAVEAAAQKQKPCPSGVRPCLAFA